MPRPRHWKERWDAEAPLMFTRRMRLGDDPDQPFVFPGCIVTKAVRQKIGKHRLKIWWEARAVARADGPFCRFVPYYPLNQRALREDLERAAGLCLDPEALRAPVEDEALSLATEKLREAVEKEVDSDASSDGLDTLPISATEAQMEEYDLLRADGLSHEEAQAVALRD